jgi:hypothetical protein
MGLMGKGAEISADVLKAFLGWRIGLRSRHIDNELKRAQTEMAGAQTEMAEAQTEMARAQTEMVKNITESMNAKKAMQEGRGVVQAKELYRSGEPITAGVTPLTPEQQAEFARHAKNYGLTYSMVKNDYDPAGKKIVMFAQRDLQKVKDITDRMTENAQITEIENRIGQLKSKGAENFAKQDYLDLT